MIFAICIVSIASSFCGVVLIVFCTFAGQILLSVFYVVWGEVQGRAHAVWF